MHQVEMLELKLNGHQSISRENQGTKAEDRINRDANADFGGRTERQSLGLCLSSYGINWLR